MNLITRKLKRGARNRSMRDGFLFRTDSRATKPEPINRKAAARKKQKAARASRKNNRD